MSKKEKNLMENESVLEIVEENINAVDNMETGLIVSKADIAGVDLINNLKNPSDLMYCSITNDGSRKSQIKIYNALSSSDNKLSEHVNEVLHIKNVIAHPVDLLDEGSGEITTVLRTILVDDKGIGYSAVSNGITNSLSKIFAIIGQPEWEEPVKVKVKNVKTRNGNNKVLTIELVE